MVRRPYGVTSLQQQHPVTCMPSSGILDLSLHRPARPFVAPGPAVASPLQRDGPIADACCPRHRGARQYASLLWLTETAQIQKVQTGHAAWRLKALDLNSICGLGENFAKHHPRRRSRRSMRSPGDSQAGVTGSNCARARASAPGAVTAFAVDDVGRTLQPKDEHGTGIIPVGSALSRSCVGCARTSPGRPCPIGLLTGRRTDVATSRQR